MAGQQNVPTEEKLDPETQRFLNATDPTKDTLTMVLKSHLLAEYYIDQIIIAKLIRGDFLKDLSFYNKWLVLKSLQVLRDDVIHSIDGLNRVRNSCSHVLDYQISEQDIDKIGQPFGLKYLQIKKKNTGDIKLLFQRIFIFLIVPLELELESLLKISESK